MKVIIKVLLLVFLPWVLAGEKIVSLPELVNPHQIIVAGDDIIIGDFPVIHIYSSSTLKLKHRFGKEGEGPGEFLKRSGYVRLNINVDMDFILVESNGRLTYFTRSGQYIRQLNSAASGYLFKPVSGSILAGHKNDSESNILHKNINLYHAKSLKPLKQVYRTRHGTQRGRDITLFDKALRSWVNYSYLYVVNGFDFTIEVFGPGGNPVYRISRKDYTPLGISERDKKDTHAHLKIALPGYERIRDRLKFPEFFPAVRNIVFDDQLLYVTTHRRDESGLECFVFDSKGKLIKKIRLPVFRESIFREYPYDIDGVKIYQLTEHSSEENWELHIRKMK